MCFFVNSGQETTKHSYRELKREQKWKKKVLNTREIKALKTLCKKVTAEMKRMVLIRAHIQELPKLESLLQLKLPITKSRNSSLIKKGLSLRMDFTA